MIAISILHQQGNMSGESFSNDKFQKALGDSLRDFPHITGLKAEQERCIKSIAGKHDVFGILPIGFGKSLIFQILPRVLKEPWKMKRTTVLVVTPLVSIMKEQVEESGFSSISESCGSHARWLKFSDLREVFVGSSPLEFPIFSANASLFRFAEGVIPIGERIATDHFVLEVVVVHFGVNRNKLLSLCISQFQLRPSPPRANPRALALF